MAEPARQARPSRGLRWGAAILAAWVALAVAAPWLASSNSPLVPFDPASIDLERVLTPPSAVHPLGTDGLGRDVAARLIHGTRASIAVGVLSALLALAIGIPVGAAAGMLGGWVDAAISRIVEAAISFPALVLLLALLAAEPAALRALDDVVRIAAVVGLTAWIPLARYLRGEIQRTARSGFVEAARAAGAGPGRILTRHLLPAALAPVVVTAAFAVAGAISLEASLSFLGLGVQPPTPSWGGLLQESRAHIGSAWWLAVFPGCALAITLLGCTMLGEGLRDALDPRAPRSR